MKYKALFFDADKAVDIWWNLESEDYESAVAEAKRVAFNSHSWYFLHVERI